MFTDIPALVIRIGVDPVALRLGPLSVHWYGLMYVAGIVVGLRIALPYAERLGISADKVYDVFWPVLIAALIGGRLYFVVQSDLGSYLRHPGNILATWEGGMAFYGAVFLGVPVAYIACRLRHVSFPRLLDAAALFIPVAQSFGRIGNIINGDIIGYPSTLAWAVRYTNPNNTFVPSHTIAYQPAAAYEMVFSAALFLVIWSLRRRVSIPGELFAIWLILYSGGQFILFFARANPVVFVDLKQAQVTALATIAVTIPVAVLWARTQPSRRDRQNANDPEQPQSGPRVQPLEPYDASRTQ
ncbi:MAG: prolipoprotein diacylglyceryl transferase [Chloroflexota bacterium]|nr:MAG: prolipoprotein diacylglyceryl transferase [Chloroflexota bacterium]